MEQNSSQLYTLFVFFLIISSNYLGELFPCKVQQILHNNVYWKHLFGFLTLLFFVVLVDPFESPSLVETLVKSIGLYSIFILLVNTNLYFFFTALVLLSGIYMISLYKNYREKYNEKTESWIEPLNNGLYLLFFVCLVIGFLVYLGEKKIEYKSKFNYATFLFGKSQCRSWSPNTTFGKSLKAAFTQ